MVKEYADKTVSQMRIIISELLEDSKTESNDNILPEKESSSDGSKQVSDGQYKLDL